MRRCPEVRFVLDHITKPAIRDGLLEPWRSEIKELSELPNVRCKLSGVITEADHAAWTRDQLRLYLDHAIDCFGFERLLYASDWPVSEQTHRYAEWVAILDEPPPAAQPASAASCSMTTRSRSTASRRTEQR